MESESTLFRQCHSWLSATRHALLRISRRARRDVQTGKSPGAQRSPSCRYAVGIGMLLVGACGARTGLVGGDDRSDGVLPPSVDAATFSGLYTGMTAIDVISDTGGASLGLGDPQRDTVVVTANDDGTIGIQIQSPDVPPNIERLLNADGTIGGPCILTAEIVGDHAELSPSTRCLYDGTGLLSEIRTYTGGSVRLAGNRLDIIFAFSEDYDRDPGPTLNRVLHDEFNGTR